MRETAARFAMALAQTEADAARIRQVGAEVVEVTGNLKFDLAPDPAAGGPGHGLASRAGQSAGLALCQHARWRGSDVA